MNRGIRTIVADYVKVDTHEAARLIEDGEVTVNGVTVINSLIELEPGDAVRVDGKRGVYRVRSGRNNGGA
jgi:ribosomal protein S4